MLKVADEPGGKPSTKYEIVPVSCTKSALTLETALIVTEQVSAMPVQAPPQPAKPEPLVGVAVSVMTVFWAKEAVHVVPQSIPPGLLETAPVPVPFFVTLSAKVGIGFVLKVAVTDCTALMVTTHDPVPVQAPFHAKLEPASGVAFSVTLEPLVKGAVHVAPQLIPAGVLETVPVPVPLFVTLKAKVVGACGLYMTLTVGFPPKLTFTDCEALLGRYVVFPTVTFGALTV